MNKEIEGNSRQSLIRDFKKKPRSEDIPLNKMPDPNCNDCFGRGYVVRIFNDTRTVESCHCLKNEVLGAIKNITEMKDKRPWKA